MMVQSETAARYGRWRDKTTAFLVAPRPPHTHSAQTGPVCFVMYLMLAPQMFCKKRTLTNCAKVSNLDVRFLETRGIVQNLDGATQGLSARAIAYSSSWSLALFGNNCEETSRGALQDASGADASSAGAPPHQCTAGGHVTWTSEWAVHNSGFRFSAGVRRPKRRTSSRSEPRTTQRRLWITSLASREVAIVMAGASIGQAVEELPRLWKIFAGSAWVYNQAVL